MRAWEEVLRRSGRLGGGGDAARSYTPALVERVNDFDAAAVRAAAAQAPLG